MYKINKIKCKYTSVGSSGIFFSCIIKTNLVKYIYCVDSASSCCEHFGIYFENNMDKKKLWNHEIFNKKQEYYAISGDKTINKICGYVQDSMKEINKFVKNKLLKAIILSEIVNHDMKWGVGTAMEMKLIFDNNESLSILFFNIHEGFYAHSVFLGSINKDSNDCKILLKTFI